MNRTRPRRAAARRARTPVPAPDQAQEETVVASSAKQEVAKPEPAPRRSARTRRAASRATTRPPTKGRKKTKREESPEASASDTSRDEEEKAAQDIKPKKPKGTRRKTRSATPTPPQDNTNVSEDDQETQETESTDLSQTKRKEVSAQAAMQLPKEKDAVPSLDRGSETSQDKHPVPDEDENDKLSQDKDAEPSPDKGPDPTKEKDDMLAQYKDTELAQAKDPASSKDDQDTKTDAHCDGQLVAPSEPSASVASEKAAETTEEVTMSQQEKKVTPAIVSQQDLIQESQSAEASEATKNSALLSDRIPTENEASALSALFALASAADPVGSDKKPEQSDEQPEHDQQESSGVHHRADNGDTGQDLQDTGGASAAPEVESDSATKQPETQPQHALTDPEGLHEGRTDVGNKGNERKDTRGAEEQTENEDNTDGPVIERNDVVASSTPLARECVASVAEQTDTIKSSSIEQVTTDSEGVDRSGVANAKADDVTKTGIEEMGEFETAIESRSPIPSDDAPRPSATEADLLVGKEVARQDSAKGPQERQQEDESKQPKIEPQTDDSRNSLPNAHVSVGALPVEKPSAGDVSEEQRKPKDSKDAQRKETKPSTTKGGGESTPILQRLNDNVKEQNGGKIDVALNSSVKESTAMEIHQEGLTETVFCAEGKANGERDATIPDGKAGTAPVPVTEGSIVETSETSGSIVAQDQLCKPNTQMGRIPDSMALEKSQKRKRDDSQSDQKDTVIEKDISQEGKRKRLELSTSTEPGVQRPEDVLKTNSAAFPESAAVPAAGEAQELVQGNELLTCEHDTASNDVPGTGPRQPQHGIEHDNGGGAPEESAAGQSNFPSLQQIKMRLYVAGMRVHRGRGAERLFANYWDALSRHITVRVHGSNSGGSGRLNGTRGDTFQSFLKTKHLRKLHNALIFAIMERCLQKNVPDDDLQKHIPVHWRNRMKSRRVDTKAVRGLQPVSRDETGVAVSDRSLKRFIYDDADSVSLTRWKSEFGFGSGVWSAGGLSESAPYTPLGADFADKPYAADGPFPTDAPFSSDSSASLPGALVIDPLVRGRVQSESLKVSESAVWLMIVAVREYTNSVLKNTISHIEALRQDQISPAPVKLQPILQSTKGTPIKSAVQKSTGQSGEEDAVPTTAALTSTQPAGLSGEKKRRCITPLDIASVLMSIPVTGALGGSTSRLTFERCFASAFDASPFLPREEFETVRGFITNEVGTMSSKRRRMSPGRADFSPEKAVKDISVVSNVDTGKCHKQRSGLGRGAKDLAALKARTLASSGSSPDAATDTGSKPVDENSTNGLMVNAPTGTSATVIPDEATGHNLQKIGDELVSAAGQGGISPTRGGKGPEFEKLAAMRVRSVTNDPNEQEQKLEDDKLGKTSSTVLQLKVPGQDPRHVESASSLGSRETPETMRADTTETKNHTSSNVATIEGKGMAEEHRVISSDETAASVVLNAKPQQILAPTLQVPGNSDGAS